MVEMPEPDQLEPAWAEAEFIVGVDVVIPAFELVVGDPAAVVVIQPDATILAMAGVPVGRVPQRQIANRRSGPVQLELALHRDKLGFVVQDFVPVLEVDAVGIVEPNRAAIGSASGIVLDREGIVDRPFLARIAG